MYTFSVFVLVVDMPICRAPFANKKRHRPVICAFVFYFVFGFVSTAVMVMV